MKGTYVLIIKLARSKDVLVGKLGYIRFSKAFYAYVGSAMSGFDARLPYHLRKKKKPHWHIDYLLEVAEIEDIVLCQVSERIECPIAQTLANEFPSIRGFGSSDCKCQSHLYFTNSKLALKTSIVEAMNKRGHVICLKQTSQQVELTGQNKYTYSYKQYPTKHIYRTGITLDTF